MWDERPAKAQTSLCIRQSYQGFCWSLEYAMNIKLLNEPHLEILGLKGGCSGSTLSLFMSKCHIVGNYMSQLKCTFYKHRKEGYCRFCYFCLNYRSKYPLNYIIVNFSAQLLVGIFLTI